jgi:hypothetical protein
MLERFRKVAILNAVVTRDHELDLLIMIGAMRLALIDGKLIP